MVSLRPPPLKSRGALCWGRSALDTKPRPQCTARISSCRLPASLVKTSHEAYASAQLMLVHRYSGGTIGIALEKYWRNRRSFCDRVDPRHPPPSLTLCSTET